MAKVSQKVSPHDRKGVGGPYDQTRIMWILGHRHHHWYGCEIGTITGIGNTWAWPLVLERILVKGSWCIYMFEITTTGFTFVRRKQDRNYSEQELV